MPYILPGVRKELMTEPERAAKDVGAMNYLYTEAILKVWNAAPKYETIHRLKIATDYAPSDFLELSAVDEMLFSNGVSDENRKTARQLAFLEAYLRIFQFYEREKRQLNGDLEGYEIATKHLNELARDNFNSRIGYKEAK